MGFWDKAGKVAGEVAGAVYNDMLDSCEKWAEYREEMEDYSEEELRKVMMDSRQCSEKRAVAKKLLE